MRCPSCNRIMHLKPNPNTLKYRERDNQALWFCSKCQKHYINKTSLKIDIKYYVIVTLAVNLFIALSGLHISFKILLFIVSIIGLIDLPELIKPFVRGCILVCDENFCPVIKKAQYRIDIPRAYNIKNMGMQNSFISVNEQMIPIIITQISRGETDYVIEFYCIDKHESLNHKYGFIMLNKSFKCTYDKFLIIDIDNEMN